MITRYTLRALVSAALTTFVAAASVQARRPNPIKFEEYDLPNGLHVILYPEHSAPTIAVRVYYHVGSKNEDPQRTGFAHFFEHLMFESTDNIKRGEYAKIVEQAGGNLNAFTSQDQTVYIDNLPANHLRTALWSESERMHWLHVDSAGVETQRQVVKEERRSRIDNSPYGTLVINLFKAGFGGSFYEWAPIGDAQYIDQATIKEFQDFYHRYYVPNNATLVIAGDFQPADAKKSVQDYFGSIPRGADIQRPTLSFSAHPEETYKEVSEKITPLPAVVNIWRTVEEGTTDHYALDMMSRVFSTGNSSRLYKRLVDVDQSALQVQAFPFSNENAGAFGTFAVVKAGVDINAVRKALDEEVARLQSDGISEEEYQKVRNQVMKEQIEQLANTENVALALAHNHTMYHDANRVNTEIDRYAKVTREDIQRVAKQYLTPKGRSVIVYTVPAADDKG